MDFCSVESAIGLFDLILCSITVFQQDQRAGTCFYSLTNGRCAQEQTIRYTKMQCCCESGRCWALGSVPEMCPIRGSDEYRRLCIEGAPVVQGVPQHGPNSRQGFDTPGLPDFDFDRRRFRPHDPAISLATVDRDPGGGTGRGEIINRPRKISDISTVSINQTNIDVCKHFTNLCLNGRCIPTPTSYRCECNMGFKQDLRRECVGLELQPIPDDVSSVKSCGSGRRYSRAWSFSFYSLPCLCKLCKRIDEVQKPGEPCYDIMS
ncbi:fibrillin-2-like [Rhincodon typus]|uniref:fibrillin-2-like n=1 Tax=Rhincodon typus TaxID=259920 RepID=UPI002030950F|nr:fibrillin-2-like [Rhincodon typus]